MTNMQLAPYISVGGNKARTEGDYQNYLNVKAQSKRRKGIKELKAYMKNRKKYEERPIKIETYSDDEERIPFNSYESNYNFERKPSTFEFQNKMKGIDKSLEKLNMKSNLKTYGLRNELQESTSRIPMAIKVARESLKDNLPKIIPSIRQGTSLMANKTKDIAKKGWNGFDRFWNKDIYALQEEKAMLFNRQNELKDYINNNRINKENAEQNKLLMIQNEKAKEFAQRNQFHKERIALEEKKMQENSYLRELMLENQRDNQKTNAEIRKTNLELQNRIFENNKAMGLEGLDIKKKDMTLKESLAKSGIKETEYYDADGNLKASKSTYNKGI